MPSNASTSSSGTGRGPTACKPEGRNPKTVFGTRRFPRAFRSACVAALPLLIVVSTQAWEIKTFAGRDHVPLEEIAAFYGLGEATSPDRNTRKLKGSGRELVATLGSREMEIDGIKHWLAFPVLEEKGRVYVSRLDLGKTLEPAFRPALIPGFSQVTTVVLDPGHGGKDNGARSPYEQEKNFVLDVARRIRNELQKARVRVVLTRNSDSFIELAERAAVATRLNNSIFVSLHFNAADGNQAANGFEIYCVTPRGAPSTAYEQIHARDMVEENGNEHDIHSFALANAIYHSMHGSLEMFDRGVKRARFAVIRLAGVPSVLIEGGFLTNSGDARKVASKQWRDNYAAAVARGILEYKKLAEHRIAPREVAAYRNPDLAPPPVVETSRPVPVPGVTLRDLPE